MTKIQLGAKFATFPVLVEDQWIWMRNYFYFKRVSDTAGTIEQNFLTYHAAITACRQTNYGDRS